MDHRRPVLRGRLGGDDLGHQPEPRGHHHRRDPRACRRWSIHNQVHRLRGRARTSSRPGSTPRPGKLDPFVLVIEGSLGNEKINGDGYWTGFGVNPSNGQPITVNEWVDRLAAEGRRGRRGRHVRDLRRHPGDEEQPDRRDGRARLPRLELEVQGRHPDREHPRLPGAAGQHDRDARCTSCFALAGHGARCPSSTTPAGPVRCSAAPSHESCNRAAFYEEGDFATEYGSDHRCLVKLGCKGPVVKCNVPLRGWVNRHRRLPERRRHLHGLHDAGLPRQVHAVHGRGPDGARLVERREVHATGPLLRWGRHSERQAQVRQGAGVAAQPRRAHDRLRRSAGRGASHGDR